MLGRALTLTVTLTLLLFLLQAVIGVLSRVLGAVLMNAATILLHSGSFIGSLLAVVVMGCFFVGLVVRLVQFISTRDPRVARERASRERAMRQRVRRPAEGVPPVNNNGEHMADPDPAVGEEEADR